MIPDLFTVDPNAWATSLLIGSGFAAFVAAVIRELFDLFGGD